LWLQHALIQVFLCGFAIIFVTLHFLTITHDRYIRPYLTTVGAWNEDLQDNLYTYDLFTCNEVTAHDKESLVVNPDETLDHMLTHGAGIFTRLANEDLMFQVRDYILWRNERISITENIPVIEFNHRYSFGLDINEVPVLGEFLQQATSRNPHWKLPWKACWDPTQP
jgi:hypothetical protein